ncbi:MAG: ABC-type multidrug transport system ATPase subunit/pSer/pThr [Verrucomicrobiales bacterium]|jgi:ABC-type multidrug transport system ATPase subunit/pSer/pThr/pTyr-binding forkhead associated (FHA) protein
MASSDIPEVVLAGGTNLRRSLEQGVPFLIGRSTSADLKLPHPSVSRSHCELLWNEDQIVLTNSEGADGTTLNKQAVTSPVYVQPGDEIGVGILKLEIVWNPAAVAAPEQTDPAAPKPTGNAKKQPKQAEQEHAVSKPGNEIVVKDGLNIGRAETSEVLLDGSRVSRLQATVDETEEGFVLVDCGRAGSLANGLPFDRHPMIIGDCLQFGTHFFRYTGYSLAHVANAAGCAIEGTKIAVEKPNGDRILEDVDFNAASGQFVGILGPSGAGKTTLLRALCGFVALAAGKVTLNGHPRDEIDDMSGLVGYVPQNDIVHLELTARQALQFSARLRLPARTPSAEIERLIESLAERLKIREHLDTRASNLSGGQLKRVNVGVELLNRPALLFLDEPTSGLDPASELELMKLLQELTYTGCTVVCTTHLMENVYLMDSIEVVMAHRDKRSGKASPGQSIFRGRSKAAKEFFEIKTLTQLYNQLNSKTPDEWQADFARFSPAGGESTSGFARKLTGPEPLPNIQKRRRRWAPPILLKRQWAILKSDWKNLLLLTAQPIIIAILIAIVGSEEHTTGKKLFLAYIAMLWFGCSNAAQELVREKEIFLREQFVGLGTHAYLISKVFGMALITCFQCAIIYGLLKVLGNGMTGSVLWQSAGLFATAITAASIGLAISAWSATRTQAATIVPLFLIPQILFSGFLFPLNDWNEALVPRVISRVVPSFACQRIMDTSQLWGEEIVPYLTGENDGNNLEERELHTTFDNLAVSLLPWKTFVPGAEFEFTIDESNLYAGEPPPPEYAPTFQWPLDGEFSPYALGDVFKHASPGLLGFVSLFVWTVVSYLFAWILLARHRS